MRCSCNCRRTPLRLQPPPRKQYANRQLSSLLDLPKTGRQAFQPRRRKHPGAPTSPPRRLCRQPRPRRVARDDRSAAPRSTRRNLLLPTLIAASFFIAWANSRTPLLNLLRQSARALIERAVLSGRRREELLNPASTCPSGCRPAAEMSARSHARYGRWFVAFDKRANIDRCWSRCFSLSGGTAASARVVRSRRTRFEPSCN